jgi:hypothetical protein
LLQGGNDLMVCHRVGVQAEGRLLARPHHAHAEGARSRERDWHIWFDLVTLLIRRARKLYASDSLGVELDNTVYALDSSTIDLCLRLFDWAPICSTKAAIKLHTLLGLRGCIPAFIYISDGKLHDVNVLDMLSFEPGAFYVMDRGYVDFTRLYVLHQAGAFFVTRAKSNFNARRVYSAPCERDSGVICDQRVALNGSYAARDYPEHLRRIRFKDPESGKTLVFLTNNTVLPALTICALYKQRCQVELFFKWIKQYLRIKKFLGTSENAVKTIAILKKELQLDASQRMTASRNPYCDRTPARHAENRDTSPFIGA